MSAPNRWAVRDAGSCTFYNLVTGDAIVTLNTLKTTGVQTTGETSYATGGPGNTRLVGFSTNRQAKLAIQDAIFDNKSIAMLTGNDPTTGIKTIDRNEVKSTTSSIITLDKTPSGAIVTVYKVNADGTNGTEYTLGTPATNTTEYSVSGKTFTFHSSVVNGTQFRIYYRVNTDSTATTISVTSDKFGSTFKVVMDVIVRDAFTKKDFAAQIIVPNAKFEDNFNLSFSASGDPAVLDLNMECLKDPVSTNMWQMVVFDEDLIV